MEKVHHQIRLRILSCSRVSENHRGPEVPEVKAPAVERLDGLARITLEEHSVKNGTLQNACSTRPRVVADLGESQVGEQPTKRSKKNDDKSAVAMLKKGDWQERGSVTDQCHDRWGNLIRGVMKSWDKSHLNVDHLMHGNWVVYFRT